MSSRVSCFICLQAAEGWGLSFKKIPTAWQFLQKSIQCLANGHH